MSSGLDDVPTTAGRPIDDETGNIRVSMSRWEALARYLDGATRKFQDSVVTTYEVLPSGLRVRREQPEHGDVVYPVMPVWQWSSGEQAKRMLEFMHLDPDGMVEVVYDAAGWLVVPQAGYGGVVGSAGNLAH